MARPTKLDRRRSTIFFTPDPDEVRDGPTTPIRRIRRGSVAIGRRSVAGLVASRGAISRESMKPLEANSEDLEFYPADLELFIARPTDGTSTNRDLLQFFKIAIPIKDAEVRNNPDLRSLEEVEQKETYSGLNEINVRLQYIRQQYEELIKKAISSTIDSLLTIHAREIKDRISQEIVKEFLEKYGPQIKKTNISPTAEKKGLAQIIEQAISRETIDQRIANNLDYGKIAFSIYNQSRDIIHRKLYQPRQDLRELIDARGNYIKEHNAQTAKKVAAKYKAPNSILTSIEVIGAFCAQHKGWIKKQINAPIEKRVYTSIEQIEKKLRQVAARLNISENELGPIAGYLARAINESKSYDRYLKKVFEEVKERESQVDTDLNLVSTEYEKQKKHSKKDHDAIEKALRISSKVITSWKKGQKAKIDKYERLSKQFLQSKKSSKTTYIHYLYIDNNKINKSPLFKEYFNSDHNTKFLAEIKRIKCRPQEAINPDEINYAITELNNFYSNQLWKKIHRIIESNKLLRHLPPSDKSALIDKIHQETIDPEKDKDQISASVRKIIEKETRYEMPQGEDLDGFCKEITSAIEKTTQEIQPKILKVQKLVSRTQLRIATNNLEFTKQQQESLSKGPEQFFDLALLLSLNFLYDNIASKLEAADISSIDFQEEIGRAIDGATKELQRKIPVQDGIKEIVKISLHEILTEYEECKNSTDFEVKLKKHKNQYLPESLHEYAAPMMIAQSKGYFLGVMEEYIELSQERIEFFTRQLTQIKQEQAEEESTPHKPTLSPESTTFSRLYTTPQKKQAEAQANKVIAAIINNPSSIPSEPPAESSPQQIIIAQTLKSQETKPLPDHAYRGIGLLSKFQNGELVIQEMFKGRNPVRFTNRRTKKPVTGEDLAGKKIELIWDNQAEKWFRPYNTPESKEKIARIFHANQDTRIRLSSGIEIECPAANKEIFITTKTSGKRSGEVYDPEKHGTRPIDPKDEIKQACYDQIMEERSASAAAR